MNILKLAWKNIVAKPLSMLLTLILFGLGIGLTAFLLLINKQLEEKFEKNLGGINKGAISKSEKRQKRH